MDRKCRRIISKYLNHLKKSVDLRKIRPLVERRQIFTKSMLDDVYDPLNDDCLFYELLCTRGPYTFAKFINILSQTGHIEEAVLLQNEFSKDYTPMPYKMTSEPIGFCMIIINEKFESLEPRIGSLVDATALESLFETLGYIVTVVWNLNGEDMEDCLLQFSQNPSFSEVDSIVVFILTHGDRINNCDVLLGTDTVPVYIIDIYTMFDNRNCPKLLGKPKIFFFQACRGSKEDIGYFECKYLSSDAVLLNFTDDEITTINHHPSMTDMIVIHSTMPYHTSLRDHEDGSWLCQDVVDVFSVDYLRHNLDTMLKSVSKRMNERTAIFENTKQTIHVELFGVTGIVKFCQRHT